MTSALVLLFPVLYTVNVEIFAWGNFRVFRDCVILVKITPSTYHYGNRTGMAKITAKCNVCLTFSRNPLHASVTA